MVSPRPLDTNDSTRLLCFCLGRYSVQGHPSFINAEFKQEALFLAEQLDCSEFYCAQLLEHALRSQPNPQFSRLAEKAVILHHQERIASIRCLKLVVETATRTDVPNTPNVAFVRALALQLIQMPLSAGLDEGETSLAIKLLTEMDKLLSLLVGHPVPSRMESTSSSSAPLNQGKFSDPECQWGIDSYCLKPGGLTSFGRTAEQLPFKNVHYVLMSYT